MFLFVSSWYYKRIISKTYTYDKMFSQKSWESAYNALFQILSQKSMCTVISVYDPVPLA